MEQIAKEGNGLFISLVKKHAEKTSELKDIVKKLQMLTPLKLDTQHGYLVSGQMKVDVSVLKPEELECFM